MNKTRWAVWFPSTKKYVGANGRLQWTYDRARAEEIALSFGGEVIDAEDLVRRVAAGSMLAHQ